MAASNTENREPVGRIRREGTAELGGLAVIGNAYEQAMQPSPLSAGVRKERLARQDMRIAKPSRGAPGPAQVSTDPQAPSRRCVIEPRSQLKCPCSGWIGTW